MRTADLGRCFAAWTACEIHVTFLTVARAWLIFVWALVSGCVVALDVGTRDADVRDSPGVDGSSSDVADTTVDAPVDAGPLCGTSHCDSTETCCQGRCIDTSWSRESCGRCGQPCAAMQACSNSTCVSDSLPGPAFRVLSLGATGCASTENRNLGDGFAVLPTRTTVAYVGSSNAVRVDLPDLANSANLARSVRDYRDSVSNLRNGTPYVFGTGAGPIRSGMATHLLELDPMTGMTNSTVIALSVPVNLPSSDVGYFSGYDRVAVLSIANAMAPELTHVLLPSGTVTRIVSGIPPIRVTQRCASSGLFYGVLEFFGGQIHLLYVQDNTTMARANVGTPTSASAAMFTNLADICAVGVSLQRNRWYWTHSQQSQFTTTSRSVGYCPMTWDLPGEACNAATRCLGTCSDPQHDDMHCGTCTVACTGGRLCRMGRCDCPSQRPLFCTQCVSPQSDPANCNGCGTACPTRPNARPICTAGVCGVACNPGMGECNGNPADGCEQSLLTTSHCGDCGVACTAPIGGTSSCTSGFCMQTCPAALQNCSGTCTALGTMSNCSFCGDVCAAGTSCNMSACR